MTAAGLPRDAGGGNVAKTEPGGAFRSDAPGPRPGLRPGIDAVGTLLFPAIEGRPGLPSPSGRHEGLAARSMLAMLRRRARRHDARRFTA